jgi:hypothetical protein
MSTRARGLQRLADLYGTVERMRSVDLKVASDSVTEASQALDTERQTERTQAENVRAALEQGDRHEWALAESQAELAGSRAGRVEHVKRAREELKETALQAYRASRLRMEQMRQMVRHVREREAAVERRRFQAALDDRHLARQMWVKAKKSEGLTPIKRNDTDRGGSWPE